MGTLDVELSSELIKEISDLAERYYGNASDDSIRRVVEEALETWLNEMNTNGVEVEEPVARWESLGRDAHGDDTVRDWLFERRR